MPELPVNRLPPVHPGEIIAHDILAELDMTSEALAHALNIGTGRMDQIIQRHQPIDPDIALRLARYLGSTPSFWLRLQAEYDLKLTEQEHGPAIEQEVVPRSQA